MSSMRGRVLHRKVAGKEFGFTIVELLIATLVFSMVLLIITTGILQVTNTFFKGDNDSSTQQVATNVLNTIAQAVQFNGGVVDQNTTANTLCIGNEQFSYWLGAELEPTVVAGQDQVKEALVENSVNCDGARSSVGRELLADNMRLSNLTVTCLSSEALCDSTTTGGALYQITVRVVYGSSGLLSPSPTATNANCNGALEGEEFCSVSAVSTIVSERL